MSSSQHRRTISSWTQWFLFESCDPRIAVFLRIGFAVLLIINTLSWLADAKLWFTDEGVLSTKTAVLLSDGVRQSLLFWLPSTEPVVRTCLQICLVQSCLLLVGFWSRFQVACLFVWLVSFQHRNPLISDGEDTVFRWFAFLMIWMPLDYRWSFSRWLANGKLPNWNPETAWALRLIQLQMAVIYASAAWNKCFGITWQQGTALYYVSRMTDHYGRAMWLDRLFETPGVVQALTWGALSIEMALPFTLWFRRTRLWAIVAGILLHLGIEITMNLFLFEWIMILGLLSFYEPSHESRDNRSRLDVASLPSA